MSSAIRLKLLIGSTVPVPAPMQIIDSIQSVEVTNTDEGRDGFQITFRMGKVGSIDLSDYPFLKNPLLKPFSRVIIIVIFGTMHKVLFDGIITHQQVNPSVNSGQATFTITGEDLSLMMDMEEKSETHPNQPDTAIVTKIILSYAQYGLTPLVIPPLSMDAPLVVDRVPSQHGTDLAYVKELAELHDYVFYIEPTNVAGVSMAYWGPPKLFGAPQKALSVNMGAHTNVTSINFQYDSLKPTVVKGYIQDKFTGMSVPVQALTSLRTSLSCAPGWQTQPHVRSKQFRDSGLNVLEALDKAQAVMSKSSDAVGATGELDVVSYGGILRARRLVGLRGVGKSFDGLYDVKSVTHKIREDEYTQSFRLTREGLGSTVSVVKP